MQLRKISKITRKVWDKTNEKIVKILKIGEEKETKFNLESFLICFEF